MGRTYKTCIKKFIYISCHNISKNFDEGKIIFQSTHPTIIDETYPGIKKIDKFEKYSSDLVDKI